ncbi:03fdef47-83cb-4a6d-95c8-b278d80cf4fc [Thermothielavioides terrestris]|uniref:03fdef47-83cb-4a6d-95c8-b278d80cf4fc n=1 Tax=Thermothielavioides terrestris TaxID=2587410 RepID=A0A446BK24_9PEZI|nr:03fdef47-83cb-4a6d-95c8-b278d80cf4fc [Thermothielavioides terrestris]
MSPTRSSSSAWPIPRRPSARQQLFNNGFGAREADTAALAARPDVLTYLHQRAAGGGRRAAHTRATTRTLACLSCSAESMTRAPPRAASATPTCGCRACNNKSRCVSCSATASTGFRTGSRIHRLLPAGGSHPRYLGNLGIEENPGTGVTMRPARYAVRHGQSAVSKLVLPVTASGAVWFGGWLMKQGLSLVLY